MSISRDRLRTLALTLSTTALAGGLLASPAQAAPLPAAPKSPSFSTPVAASSPLARAAVASPVTSSSRVTSLQVRRVGVLQTAASLKGRPYRYGATGPSAFDCSGYTKYVFNRNGISLPRTANQQYRAARKISKRAARPGDLVFLGGSNKHHVGIYAGNGKMWHSPRTGKSVRLVKIWTSNWSAGRVVG